MQEKADTRTLLEQLNLAIRQETEHAEPYFRTLNMQLRQLHSSGLFPNVALLGPVVLVRPYGVDGPWDTGEIVQAALGLPSGFGAIYWDTEEIGENQDESEVCARISPYEGL